MKTDCIGDIIDPCAQRRKLRHHIEILVAEETSAIDSLAEHVAKIGKTKIVHVFIEDVEPSLALADTAKGRHVDAAAAAIGAAPLL